jgi:hypothetical protein
MALEAIDVDNVVHHRVTRSRNFRLVPAGSAVSTVMRAAMPMTDSPRRVFTKKWPGAVSGFDKLLKSRDQATVERRMQLLFNTAAEQTSRREEGLEELGRNINANAVERAKLEVLADQIASLGIRYERERIRRALTGSAPRSSAWYPDGRMKAWLYYEPRFTFERAIHEGRTVGWGTSNQWREPATHAILPKLVFTTSTNPEAGLKAFVLTDQWIVLKAAGTRQQLNYTAINNPLRGVELAGPNNLGAEALVFYHDLIQRNYAEEDFLLYVAAVYNSALAGEYLVEGGENVMHIPLASNYLDPEIVDTVIRSARRLRDLTWLRVEADPGESIGDEFASRLTSQDTFRELGFARVAGSGGRFRQNPGWQRGPQTFELLRQAQADVQVILDDGVRSLFEQTPQP